MVLPYRRPERTNMTRSGGLVAGRVDRNAGVCASVSGGARGALDRMDCGPPRLGAHQSGRSTAPWLRRMERAIALAVNRYQSSRRRHQHDRLRLVPGNWECCLTRSAPSRLSAFVGRCRGRGGGYDLCSLVLVWMRWCGRLFGSVSACTYRRVPRTEVVQAGERETT